MFLSSSRARPLFAASLAIALALSTASPRAAGVSPAQASAVQREQAQARFQHGRELFTKESYPDALVEFRGSFDIVASPNTRLFIARCLRQMGNLVEAYTELGQTAMEAKELALTDARYAKAAEAATIERKEVEEKLAFVTVDVQHAGTRTTLKIAGQEMSRGSWSDPTPVMPGTIEVMVESPLRQPVRRFVTATAGANSPVVIDAGDVEVARAPIATAPAPTERDGGPSQTMRTGAYVAAGVGGAGVVTFIVFGALANSKYSTLQSECGGTTCPQSKVDLIEAGRRDQRIANIGLAIGAVGLGVGITLFVLSRGGHPEEKSAAATAALTFGPGSIALQGAF